MKVVPVLPVYVIRSLPMYSAPDDGQPVVSSTVIVVTLLVWSCVSLASCAQRLSHVRAVSLSRNRNDSGSDLPIPPSGSTSDPIALLSSMTRPATSEL